MKLDDWVDTVTNDESVLKADGYDDCVVGILDNDIPRLVYSIDKIIAKLMKNDGMGRGDALEWYSYNISNCWVGDSTPIYMWEKRDEKLW